jgi:hypothetical protein
LGGADSAKAYFSGLIKFMRDSVIVVRLTVPNESNAFRVFETLNDRGMDLSAFDLLKNYLFGCVHNVSSMSRLKQMEHRWSQLTGTLQNARPEDFLKVYWTSRHGLVLLDDIFDEVKRLYKTVQQAEKFSIDLQRASVHYAALDEPDDAVWAERTETTKSLIRNLRILGSKLVRPVILSGFEKLVPNQFEKLLWVLEVIIVRWQVIGEGRTGTIERTCARLAQQIWDGKVTNRKGAITTLGELYLDDKEFQNRFSTQQGIASQKAVYLLKKIEDAERTIRKSGAGKELSPNKNLTLEHVLPSNPAQDWSPVVKSDPKVVVECAARLGNLCLLTEGMNREAGRAGYGKKRKIYEASELLTTRHVSTFPTWTRKSIEERQMWLANKAVAIWRLD